jgi:hypothetical protein
MRDINRSRHWTEIPPTNSDALRSVMGEVLQNELGQKYFPTHNIHPNYYELLRKTLYWKQVRLDYPTPKNTTPGQANLTQSGKRRGRPPKYVVEERAAQQAAAAAGQPTLQQQQQHQQQQQQQHQQQQQQQETPTMQQNKKRKRDTMINDQLTQNSSHTLTDSPLLDYGTAALNRDRFLPPTPTQYYRVRVASTDGKVSRHAFPHGTFPYDLTNIRSKLRGCSRRDRVDSRMARRGRGTPCPRSQFRRRIPSQQRYISPSQSQSDD